VDLNEVVWESVRMLRRLLGEAHTVELKRPSTPLVLNADAGMIEQVLMNLALNARDAMPNGGKITISLAPADKNAVPTHAIGPGPRGYVALSVADAGTGIAPDDLQRVFEPFFTTKEVGKGTGLGLSVVDGIVRQHGGWVWVDSTVGKGSVFTIYLPQGPELAPEAPVPGADAPVRGTERILLVEDDGALRSLTARVLRGLGYAVTEASSGPAALALWKNREAPFKLLLTDMVMPGGLTGAELGRKLCREDLGLRVLVTSGYHREMPSTAKEGFAFLPKPFSSVQLARAVRDELDRVAAAAK
jgi:CheY-like chemotaxis protein